MHEEIEYVHANPVRRKLVESPEQWEYSSAAFWAGAENYPIAMDETVPPYEEGLA